MRQPNRATVYMMHREQWLMQWLMLKIYQNTAQQITMEVIVQILYPNVSMQAGFHRIELGIGIRVPQIGFVQDITTMAVLFHILREKDILDRFPLVVQQQRGVLCIITRRAMLPL